MDIRQVYRQFQFRLNKLGTNANQNFPLAQFVYLVNKAQLHWVESRAKVFENDQSRTDELQQILKDLKADPVKKDNYYKIPLPKDYLHPVRAVSSTKCGVIYIKPVEEGNVNALLQNEFTRPSAEWEETFYTIFGGELRAYVTDFTLGKIDLKYLRKPVEVDIAGYIKADGSASGNIDLEFEGVNAQEIIDLAVQIGSTDIGDLERYQTATQQIQANP